jgi:hypothetical protein
MPRPFKLPKRLATTMVTTALLVTGGAVVSPALAARSAPDSQPPFSFCNESGGKIGCFNANIEFLAANQYKLSNIKVSDTLCDDRSVLADLYDSYNAWTGVTYANGEGCNKTKDFVDTTITADGPVETVWINLYACNLNPITNCSGHVLSGTRTNPWYKATKSTTGHTAHSLTQHRVCDSFACRHITINGKVRELPQTVVRSPGT